MREVYPHLGTIVLGVVLSLFRSVAFGSTSLPLGDVNIVVVTDVHSWIGGHARHEPQWDADYGVILSFYEHLQEIVREEYDNDKNLFFVMNGDFLDGTGLTTFPPAKLTELLKHMPWDAINVGNHELYSNETIDYLRESQSAAAASTINTTATTTVTMDTTNATDINITSATAIARDVEEEAFIPYWGDAYITSNVVMTSNTSQTFGNTRYKILKGPTANLLTFGFLYDMKSNAKRVTVQPVEEVVTQDWFLQVLNQTDSYDAILCLAHMHFADQLVQVLRQAMRDVVGPDMPILFLTGHSHMQAYSELDETSVSFEAGHYLDTVGFASFRINRPNNHDELDQIGNETLATNTTMTNSTSSSNSTFISNATTTTTKTTTTPFSSNFEHVYLAANQQELKTAVGGSTHLLSTHSFMTPNGTALQTLIRQAQQDLGLLERLGCNAQHYSLDYELNHPQSLWGLYLFEVMQKFHFHRAATTAATTAATAAGEVTRLHDDEATHLEVAFCQSVNGLRYDAFAGVITLDDVISICPYNDTIYKITSNITGEELLQILQVEQMNSLTSSLPWQPTLPAYPCSVLQEDFDRHKRYDLYSVDFDQKHMVERVINVTGREDVVPVPMAEGGGTTQIWMDFVQAKWQNEKDCEYQSPEYIYEKKKNAKGSENAEEVVFWGMTKDKLYVVAGLLVSAVSVIGAMVGSILMMKRQRERSLAGGGRYGRPVEVDTPVFKEPDDEDEII